MIYNRELCKPQRNEKNSYYYFIFNACFSWCWSPAICINTSNLRHIIENNTSRAASDDTGWNTTSRWERESRGAELRKSWVWSSLSWWRRPKEISQIFWGVFGLRGWIFHTSCSRQLTRVNKYFMLGSVFYFFKIYCIYFLGVWLVFFLHGQLRQVINNYENIPNI